MSASAVAVSINVRISVGIGYVRQRADMSSPVPYPRLLRPLHEHAEVELLLLFNAGDLRSAEDQACYRRLACQLSIVYSPLCRGATDCDC